MNGPVLEVEGLWKKFGDLEAVRGVGFHIEPGETYGLLGPNGAGKTTTISMVAGVLRADAGSITVDSIPMTVNSMAAKAAVGMVPQDVAVYPDLTARENLAFFGRLYGMGGQDLSKRVGEVLEVIGLKERGNDLAKEFSGGMKRRLNIGIGLLHKPRLLVLDEPTVGVDPQSRNAILESVEHLSGEGMAVLYTTHYMEEAERLCDRVAIIDEGEFKAEGTRRELVKLIGKKDRIRVEAGGRLEDAAAEIAKLPSVEEATAGEGFIDLLATDAGIALPAVVEVLGRRECLVSSISLQESDLEAVFLHLTGKALRD